MKIIYASIFLLLAGCASQSIYDLNLNSSGRVFSDENISISFSFPTANAVSRTQDFTTYKVHTGIGIVLENKTNKNIVIDWNQVTMRDNTGASGKQVMHEGVKYKDCADSKVPTTLPPKGFIRDIITPCYGVWFSPSGWNASMLPEPKLGNVDSVGLALPLKIGDELKNYDFTFTGKVLQ
ncbi:MAG: hypothetical protein KAT04_06575 [Methylococcales bacterium]|nr:hypothetical protein [Methylococcales bacterium]